MAPIINVETAAVDLGALLDAEDGAIVTMIAGETRLMAHKAVLSARSPVLAAMFQHDTLEASSGQVTIPDVEGEVLRQMLTYMYTLQAPKLPNMAPKLLAVADKYGLSALKSLCEQQVIAQLAVDNAAAAAVLAVRYSCQNLTAAAIAFVKAHTHKVLATQCWADAMRNQLEDVIEVTRLLAEPSAETSMLATTGSTPTSSSQFHRDHSQTRVTNAQLTAPSHTPPPDNAIVSRMRSLPPEEKGRKLIESARAGAVQELQALVAAGADVNAWDEEKRTALQWAGMGGHVEAVRSLLESGAEVGIRNIRQNTPLHAVAVAGHAAVIRLLTSYSADPNARGNLGRTPLHWAACCGHIEAAAALLEAGANKWARDDSGAIPRHLASENGHQQIVDLLT
ncbi:ankyrin-1-like [Schistocerca piceifrons]|uniref:ankyrin-1-like n=1 Tax=Schistocerca piceifrons TaxID=274613 RepID=UPI001F5F2F1D|nr:ankyrin-1-like [Schistocerca piceifrons]